MELLDFWTEGKKITLRLSKQVYSTNKKVRRGELIEDCRKYAKAAGCTGDWEFVIWDDFDIWARFSMFIQ